MQRTTYTIEFKKQLVLEALTGEKTIVQIAVDNGITERMLHSWLTTLGFAAGNPLRRSAREAQGLRGLLRDDHNRRLSYIYSEAASAWGASRAEHLELSLKKYARHLKDTVFTTEEGGEHLIPLIVSCARAIFTADVPGNPRFLREMLAAMGDERKMWNANLSGGKQDGLEVTEVKSNDEVSLSDEERLSRILQILNRVQKRHQVEQKSDTNKSNLPGNSQRADSEGK